MNKKSKVVVLPCEAYEEEKIYYLLKAGLKELGGLEALIGKEEKLLLKPNLLKKAEVEKAVITHPVVVGAFARILREDGYANIVLADSYAGWAHVTGFSRLWHSAFPLWEFILYLPLHC